MRFFFILVSFLFFSQQVYACMGTLLSDEETEKLIQEAVFIGKAELLKETRVVIGPDSVAPGEGNGPEVIFKLSEGYKRDSKIKDDIIKVNFPGFSSCYRIPSSEGQNVGDSIDDVFFMRDGKFVRADLNQYLSIKEYLKKHNLYPKKD